MNEKKVTVQFVSSSSTGLNIYSVAEDYIREEANKVCGTPITRIGIASLEFAINTYSGCSGFNLDVEGCQKGDPSCHVPLTLFSCYPQVTASAKISCERDSN